MENFRFFVPTDIRFGRDRLSELPEALAKFGKRVLVVYGGWINQAFRFVRACYEPIE